MYSDDYVYENATSGSLTRELNVFNVDLPAPNVALGWWGSSGSSPVQRRFVRFAPSLLISAEARLFGHRPWPYHLVTLGLHIGSCAVVYLLALRWLKDRRKALITALVPAAHPIAMGVVANTTWQPAAVTTFAMVLAAWAWIRFRRTGAVGIGALALLLTFVTMTSYEVGVVVPMLVAGADWYFARRASWGPRWATLALYPVYGVIYRIGHTGLVYPEVSRLRPLGHVWRALRLDGANYVLKTILVFDPHDVTAYWLFNTIGEAASWILLAAVLLPLLLWARRRPVAVLGIVAWACLLAPPYLARATAQGMSYPMLRQVYAPLFALPLLVAAALEASTVSLKHRIAFGSLVAIECVQSLLTASWFPTRKARVAATEQFQRAAADADAAKPLVVLNDQRRCMYNPRFDWPERDVLRPVPLPKSGSMELRRLDDETLEAFAPAGFDLPLVTEELLPDASGYSAGRGLITRRPPLLVTAGEQTLEGARVSVTERDARGIRRLRVRFEHPLDSYVFLDVVSCDHDVERIDPGKLAPATGS